MKGTFASTKAERVTVIHCFHNLEECYEAAVKQKLLEHRNAFTHILTTGLGEDMKGYLIDRSKIKLKWSLDTLRQKIEAGGILRV